MTPPPAFELPPLPTPAGMLDHWSDIPGFTAEQVTAHSQLAVNEALERAATTQKDMHKAMMAAWTLQLEAAGIAPSVASKIVTETCEKLQDAAIRAMRGRK